MTYQPNTLRKAVDRSGQAQEKPAGQRIVIDKETVISESRQQYRGFLEAINRASDKEIARALKMSAM